MKNAILKTIEQSDNVSLYSICFNGSDISEFEDFLICRWIHVVCVCIACVFRTRY